MSGNIKITGVPTTPGPDGSTPIRMEIRDLQSQNPDLFNLFLLGLRAFQGLDEKQMLSYYQIAGIHGEPYKAWNNVQGNTDFDFGGYCTHSSVLFTTWHRPYLALFEQALYNSVQDVAKQFPSALRDRYVAAAKSFRLPYFDWAIRPATGSGAFPTSLSAPKIALVDVDGQTKSIDNPLLQFSFHPVSPSPGDIDASWSQYRTTVRYPDRNGNSNNAMIARVLNNESASLRTNMALLLLSYKDFNAFSSNRWASGNPAGTFGSLEDVHNEIHVKVGGNGHMSALEVSSFDPIFWLHHCNIDRFWAMWQDLNPTSFITPEPAPQTTFSTNANTLETQDSPLTPFWDLSGTKFWTSVNVKTTKTFGYAYPETQQWKYPNAQAYQQALRQRITQLYGANVFQNFAANIESQPVPTPARSLMAAAPAAKKEASVTVAAIQDTTTPPVHAIDVDATDGQNGQKPLVAGAHPVSDDKTGHSTTPPIPAHLAHLAPNGKYTEWIVNVRALKHCLGQTYNVMVFLGDIGPNPEAWPLEYNCVGRVTVLGRSSGTSCGKCRTDAANDLQVTGTVPLTSALLQDITAGRLPGDSLGAAAVAPHLRENLKWRVTLFNGEEKPAVEVPGLKVSVVSTEVTIGADGLPHYSGQYMVHGEITTGVPGGIGQGDEP